MALEHLATYVLAVEPPRAETGRASRRILARETTTRTLVEDAAFFAGRM